MRGVLSFLFVFLLGHYFGDTAINAAEKAYHAVKAEVVNASR